jgi:hypothetical protein
VSAGVYSHTPCPYCGHGNQAFAMAVAQCSADIRTNERQRCISILRKAKHRVDQNTATVLEKLTMELLTDEVRDA